MERIKRFKSNTRGYVSLWIFSALFILTIFAELLANDVPLLVVYNSHAYFPVAHRYSEKTFGGEFDAPADYRDPEVSALIREKGFLIWPPIRFSYATINYDLPSPALRTSKLSA